MQTNELPMVDVLRLQVLDGHRLWVRFTDGNEGDAIFLIFSRRAYRWSSR